MANMGEKKAGLVTRPLNGKPIPEPSMPTYFQRTAYSSMYCSQGSIIVGGRVCQKMQFVESFCSTVIIFVNCAAQRWLKLCLFKWHD